MNLSDNRQSISRKHITPDSAPRASRTSYAAYTGMPFKRKHSMRPSRSSRPRKQNPLTKILNAWWDRLVGAMNDGGFSSADEQYEAHSTRRDYLWNTIGLIAWGMLFPLLTIIVTQLCNVDVAGMFSIVFVTANLLYIVGTYGARTYQISDLHESHSFLDYQVHRVITCVIMLVCGYAYCTLRGYSDELVQLCIAVFLFKMIDALADAYEGRLQQVDKLYLGGISQTLRSGLALILFIIVLAITRSVVFASYAMFIGALITFVLVTFPLALLETPRSRPLHITGVVGLFKACLPLFAALFMYALVDSMPKFVMDGVLSYDNQLYFNALYFPAQAVLLSVGFIYKPQLVRMSQLWADVSHRKKFDIFIIAMMVLIAVITLIVGFMMNLFGVRLLGLMYGLDFTEHTNLALIMIAAGGVTAGIDFLYQVITILRRQKAVTELYVITLGFSILVLLLMVNITGLQGAVIGYLVVMAILLVLLLREYITVRIEYVHNPSCEAAREAYSRHEDLQPHTDVSSVSTISQIIMSDELEKVRRKIKAKKIGIDPNDESFNAKEDARERLAQRLLRQRAGVGAGGGAGTGVAGAGGMAVGGGSAGAEVRDVAGAGGSSAAGRGVGGHAVRSEYAGDAGQRSGE